MGSIPADPIVVPRRLSRFPLTIAIFSLVATFGTWTTGRPDRYASLINWFGLNWSDLAQFRLNRLASAVLVQSRPGIRATIGLLLLVIPLAEWRLGSKRAAVVLFLGDWFSTISVLVGLRIAAALGSDSARTLAMTRDGGTSSGVHALAAASIAGIDDLRVRRVFATLLIVELLGLLVVTHRLFDMQHALAACAGWAMARHLRRQP